MNESLHTTAKSPEHMKKQFIENEKNIFSNLEGIGGKAGRIFSMISSISMEDAMHTENSNEAKN